MDEIPPVGVPLAVRGRRDLSVVLDEFTPTHLDAWVGRAAVLPAGVRGVPSDAPELVRDDPDRALLARVVVVRHRGAVSGRRPMTGARRRRLDALMSADPPAAPLLAVVVDGSEVTAAWVAGSPGDIARQLSQPDWRTVVG